MGVGTVCRAAAALPVDRRGRCIRPVLSMRAKERSQDGLKPGSMSATKRLEASRRRADLLMLSPISYEKQLGFTICGCPATAELAVDTACRKTSAPGNRCVVTQSRSRRSAQVRARARTHARTRRRTCSGRQMRCHAARCRCSKSASTRSATDGRVVL